MWWNSQPQHLSRRSCPGWRRPHPHRKAPSPIHAILHEEDCELFIRIRIRNSRALETEPLDRSYTTYCQSSYLTLNIIVTLKCGLEVTGNWKWYLSKAWVRFLIHFHNNYGTILYHLRDWSNIAKYFIPRLLLAPRSGSHRRNFAKMFDADKTRVVWLPRGRNHDNMLSRFDRIPERDRRTDRQT